MHFIWAIYFVFHFAQRKIKFKEVRWYMPAILALEPLGYIANFRPAWVIQ
jgi:hypothetical protein